MKYKTVSSLCDGIAEAIKEKEGSTALINPQDFADRIKALEVGGGIPDVPTLECWKIDLSSISGEEPDYIKSSCISALISFTSAGDTSKNGKSIVLSEIDGNIYGGIGPLYVVGSGHEEITANIFYIAFMNVGFQGDFYSPFQYDMQWFREDCLDVAGEQISLYDFLSIAAQAQNYGYANEL